MLRRIQTLILLQAILVLVVSAHAQQGRWAGPDDPTAKYMIDAESQWAESACTHNKIEEKILADDFQGTAPDGKRYTKAEAVKSEAIDRNRRDCRYVPPERKDAVHTFGELLPPGLQLVSSSSCLLSIPAFQSFSPTFSKPA
jgi:hypothetical protein